MDQGGYVMGVNTDLQASEQTVQRRILSLLNGLSPENLILVERFVQFLRDQVRKGQPMAVAEQYVPYIYPSVSVSPATLDRWMGLLPEGYEGDALVDTEALYDEV